MTCFWFSQCPWSLNFLLSRGFCKPSIFTIPYFVPVVLNKTSSLRSGEMYLFIQAGIDFRTPRARNLSTYVYKTYLTQTILVGLNILINTHFRYLLPSSVQV